MSALDPGFLTLPLAHRGLHDVTDGRPENSRAAVQSAIRSGYGIEIDLQLSKDSQAIVFHDYALERLSFGKGALAQYTRAALAKIALRGGQETIPSLSDILDLVEGQCPLLIELKDQDGQMGPNVGRLEQATADALKGYAGPVALMSFNPHSVAKLSMLLPDIPRGIVTSAYTASDWPTLPATTRDALRDVPDYDRVGATFVSHEVADLHRPRILELKQSGAHILCWTVKSPELEAKAREVAENITFEQYLAPHPA